MSYEENNVSEEERKKLELIENFLQKISFIKELNDRTTISSEINTLTKDLNTQIKANFSKNNSELVKQIIQKLKNPEKLDSEVFEYLNKLKENSFNYKLLKLITFYADEIEAHNEYALRFLITISKPYRQINYTIASLGLYPFYLNMFYNDLSVSFDKDKIEILKSMLKFLKRIENELLSP